MRIGISTACFFPQLSTEQTLPVIADLGVHDIEWFMQTSGEYQPAFTQSSRETMESLSIAPYSIHAMTTQFEPQLFSPAPRQRADAWKVLDLVLSAGQALKAQVYAFHGQANVKASPGMYKITDSFISTTRALVDHCAEYNIRLAWENVFWASFRHPSFALDLRREVPGIAFTLDIKQALVVGENPFDYLEACGDALCNVHICDVDGNGHHCLPGRGVFDFVTLGKVLRNMDFHGGVMLEVYSNDFANPQELGDAWAWVSDTLQY